jgi:hypothetical protein
MKRVAMLMGGAIVAAGLAIGATSLRAHEGEHKESDAGKSVTITGELIDTACFVSSDGEAKGKDHAECGSKCLATGIPAGILPQGAKDEHAMLFLLTNPKPLAPYVSKTIKVEGKRYEGLHAFDAQKVFVQDGGGWKEIQLDDEHHEAAAGGGHDDHADHDHAH